MITKIDPMKCTGCGICLDWCPSDVIRPSNQIEEISPCMAACPAGVDIRGIMTLLKTRSMGGAIELIREALPLPAVTGRVCFHPCETGCARKKVDESINISALERFVADNCYDSKMEEAVRTHVAKVAVIGSGPAGLSCAYFLIRMGYLVTVFESMSELGGMLRVGIPEYRLPRDILDREINIIRNLGVKFRTDITIGRDMTIQEIKKSGYKSIFIAVGAHANLKLNIPGEEMSGVHYGLEFLRAFHEGRKMQLGGNIVVLGDGDFASDSARVALRLGADKVFLVCNKLRKREINCLKREGVEIINSAAPTRILGEDHRVDCIECIKVEAVKPVTGGRGPIVPIRGSEFKVDADMVISAVGRTSDLSLFPKKLKSPEGSVKVASVSLKTALPGVFAGGDAISGPTSVVESIASGKRAAISIDRYLRGQDLKKSREKELKKVNNPSRDSIEKRPKQAMPFLPVTDRVKDFREIKLGYKEVNAITESRRCMTCGGKATIAYPDDCLTCYRCELHCPYDAIYVHPFKQMSPGVLKSLEGGKNNG